MSVPLRSFRRGLLWAMVLALLVWTVFPFYWAAAQSIKPGRLLFSSLAVPWLQFRPIWTQWSWEWLYRWDVEGMGTAWVNGVLVGLGVAVATTGVGLLAAVGLLRMRRQRLPVAPLIALFVLPRVVPPIALVPPYVILLRVTRLVDTRFALVAMHGMLALPLAILLCDSAVRELPHELLEAAQLDGAGWGRTLLQVIAPLTRPILVANGALAFALSWNEYLLAEINHLRHVTTTPVAVMMMDRKDGVDFGSVGSHLVLTLLPPVLLVLAAQRFLVRGLTLGAIHG
jgi:multiple sugar transport system permease protein